MFLSAAIRKIVPSDIAMAAGPINSQEVPLFAEESEAIRDAVPARRQEFIAGRSYARAALKQIDCSNQPIPVEDRRPIWPQGFIGSISHSGPLCGVIAAHCKVYLGLGLDIESDDPLDPDLYGLIGSGSETGHFSASIKGESGFVDRAKLVFSAKEAVFKACNPVNRQWLDFQDVKVELHEERRQYVASLVSGEPLLPGYDVLTGYWAEAEKHIVTAVCVRRDDVIGRSADLTV